MVESESVFDKFGRLRENIGDFKRVWESLGEFWASLGEFWANLGKFARI